VRLGDANSNTSYIITVSDVGICFLLSSFAFGLSLLFLTLIYIFFRGFTALTLPAMCLSYAELPQYYRATPPSSLCFSLCFTCLSVSSVVVLPFISAVLYYVLDAQLFLLPHHVPHRKSNKISHTFQVFAFKYTAKISLYS